MTPDRFPAPVPPEPESPQGLKALLQYRFLLVALAIVLFFAVLFGWGWFRKAGTAKAPVYQEAPLAALPAETTPASSPETPSAEVAAPAKAAAPDTALTEKPAPPAAAPPSLAPAPPPPPAVPLEKIKGVTFTKALIKIIDDQVNQPLFGWRPNTIIFGKLGLTDNVNNLQLGVLDVARRTAIVLNESMTRFAITESYNPQVNEAMNFLMVSPDKYWFPSASGKYREAIQDLETYAEALRQGRSRFYNRVDNLIALFNNYKDILGSCYYNLVKDTEADGRPVSFFNADDYFYFSSGVAQSMAVMLEAVKEDFHEQLQKKNTHKLLEDAIHALHAASHLSPWVVTDGAKDGILANHRANMSTYIGEAEHIVATMQSVLATN
uniref:DUF2333 family protein n=1 Tax=Desulfobacca acetoxidans TaxID=60893 RepID=A0A7C3UXH7_9BACT